MKVYIVFIDDCLLGVYHNTEDAEFRRDKEQEEVDRLDINRHVYIQAYEVR